MSDAAPPSELQRMREVETQLAHVWMVRTFLKHSEEAEEDDELNEVHRTLYDVMHALGAAAADDDAESFYKQAKKKLRKLRSATELFLEIQPEISNHTNFKMAAQSLKHSVQGVEQLMEVWASERTQAATGHYVPRKAPNHSI